MDSFMLLTLVFLLRTVVEAIQSLDLKAKIHSTEKTSSNSKPTTKYYWPHARGNIGQYGLSSYDGPANLKGSLAWSWHHPDGQYHTTIVGGPLLDHEKNIYLSAEDGVRKFTQHGHLVWHYKPNSSIATCPSLMDGALFGNTADGHAFALDMASGEVLWSRRVAKNIGGDTAYVEAHQGVVVAGFIGGSDGAGNKVVMGLDAANGDALWEYHPAIPVWNFMALFPGDDTTVFMDFAGGVHKLGLHNGTQLWHVPPKRTNTFSDGGMIIGPHGISYTCSNFKGSGQEGQPGVLRAFRVSDGHMLFERVLPHPCNSWPAIYNDGKTVVVPAGAFVGMPMSMIVPPKDALKVHDAALALGDKARQAFGMPNLHGTIMAFDAHSGQPQWQYEVPKYGRVDAAGDEEGVADRFFLKHRTICLPAQWGSPTAGSDGTVFVPRANGDLYAVRNAGHGNTVDSRIKVSSMNLGSGFLHPATSFAPGLMAIANCDSLFVFKY